MALGFLAELFLRSRGLRFAQDRLPRFLIGLVAVFLIEFGAGFFGFGSVGRLSPGAFLGMFGVMVLRFAVVPMLWLRKASGAAG